MSGADHDSQFHLATDASQTSIGGVLFQLAEVPSGTEASPRYRDRERIIMFISFRLSDAESRYLNTEREALAVVRCLAEVRWLVIGSLYPVKLYTDHQALLSILGKGAETSHRISNWQDRLNEYDFEIHHRPGRSHLIGIADGLSRMPTRYNSVPVAEDASRLALPVLRVNPVDPHNRFLRSKEYGDLVAYLKGGILELQNRNLGRNQIKNTKRKADYYTLTDRGLLKRERNGFMSKCILRDEVPKVLKDLHDGCGHFATAITLDRTVGNFFWPTRTRDIEQYCLSCKTCQRMGYKRQSTELIPIQRFEPLAMIGLDFLGPINPECEVTQTKYVLIAVDYFSRFVWARPYPKASGVFSCRS
jgi:RNase H-like domain found in reverse transcriptase/Integrase zinc binding domain